MAQVLPAGASNEASPHVRLFSAGLPLTEAPRWYYQDLQGQLQGPFDASTMSRWCGEGALPGDLKCLGVHPQDSNLGVNSAALSAFQPLSKLLENAQAGIQYMPLRLGKGSSYGSEEGPATPQSAAPPKGSRAAGAGGPGAMGGLGGSNHASQPPSGSLLGNKLSNGGPDVTRAVDQRASLAAAAAAAAAGGGAGGGMNGFTAQQQGAGGLQGAGLMHHLQQMQQRAGVGAGAGPSSSQPQLTPARTQFNLGSVGPASTGVFMPGSQQPQAAQPQQQQQQDGGGDDAPAELTPHSEAWEPAMLKLLKREGFSGKDADVKWRVILASGGSCFRRGRRLAGEEEVGT